MEEDNYIMKKVSSLEFYLDTLVIQAAFGNDKLVKQAEGGVTDELISGIKNYIGSKIDNNDKLGSVINILAPGAITVMLSALGLGWVSYAVGLAMEIFHVDTDAIIHSILGDIVGKVKTQGAVSSDEIKSSVDAAFSSEISKEPTKEEIDKAELMNKAFTVRQALIYKISMFEAIKEYELTKNAGIFSLTKGARGGTVTLLSKIIKWVFLVVFSSASLMVAGDAVGRPNSFTGGIQGGKPIDQAQTPPPSVSKQTLFKANTGYDKVLNSSSATWIESVAPNNSNIRNLVLDWMSEIYPETNQFEGQAANTAGFRNVVEEIQDYNAGNAAGKITYIPRMFVSKKAVVDVFIDDVASKAHTTSAPTTAPNTPSNPLLSKPKPGSIISA